MILTILVFLLILSILVLSHEAGHFFASRSTGTKVEEFGLGFPPRVIGFYKNEAGKRVWVKGSKLQAEEVDQTIYSLNRWPIGGFCAIKGQDDEDKNENTKDNFAGKNTFQKIWMLSAGVIFNFILAMVFLAVGFMIGMPSVVGEKTDQMKSISASQIQIIDVVPGLPADNASLKMGDIILNINDAQADSVEYVQEITRANENQTVKFQIRRGDEIFVSEIVPQVYEEFGNRAVTGVSLMNTAVVSYKFFPAIWQGIRQTVFVTGAIFIALFELIKNGQIASQVAGPIGIASATGQMIDLGFVYILQFAALLSINLGIINILPFPALDGGRLVFVIYEGITRRKVNKKIENIVHGIGFTILMILIVLVTYKDIIGLF
jgi:regulator of sigma E protease